jgi:hypothetical protein
MQLTGNHIHFFISYAVAFLAFGRHCQTNLNSPAKGAGVRRSGRQLTPLGQGGR